MHSSISTISAVEFATALALRPNLVAWFLGAGASAASGIPTGYAMIRDFKAQIFCRENNLSKREIDTLATKYGSIGSRTFSAELRSFRPMGILLSTRLRLRRCTHSPGTGDNTSATPLQRASHVLDIGCLAAFWLRERSTAYSRQTSTRLLRKRRTRPIRYCQPDSRLGQTWPPSTPLNAQCDASMSPTGRW